MRVFDFDNTIYKGESTFDFAVFVIRKKPSLLRYLPSCINILLHYKFGHMNVDTFTKYLEKYAKIVLKNKELICSLVDEFWLQNIDRIYPHMLKKIRKDDVILTTAPDFLMKGIQDILPTDHLFTTRVDFQKGKILYLNFHENKVKNFQKHYHKEAIDELYTDSYNDQPLIDIAKHFYLVKNGVMKQMK